MAALMLGISGASTVACDPDCDDDMLPLSVVVVVTNEAGDYVRADSVTYSVDGEPFQDCTFEGLEYVCGLDRTGTFTVRVELGDEIFEESRTVGRDANNCIRGEIIYVTDTRPCAGSDGGCP